MSRRWSGRCWVRGGWRGGGGGGGGGGSSPPPSRSAAYPLLLKPNAGGFGAGIVRFAGSEELHAAADTVRSPPADDDGVALLQEYLAPADGFIYRVWFLGPKVDLNTKRSYTYGYSMFSALSEIDWGVKGSR